MKIWAVHLILLFPLMAFGQTKQVYNKNTIKIKSSPKLKVAFTMYNHAERLLKGVTTYVLTDSLVEIKKQYLGEKKSNVIYSTIVSNSDQLLSEFNRLNLDSLKTYYFNECVLITSGDEYSLSLEYSFTKISISLHHYYIKEVAETVNLINSTLPDKYHFRYVSEKTEQGCK